MKVLLNVVTFYSVLAGFFATVSLPLLVFKDFIGAGICVFAVAMCVGYVVLARRSIEKWT